MHRPTSDKCLTRRLHLVPEPIRLHYPNSFPPQLQGLSPGDFTEALHTLEQQAALLASGQSFSPHAANQTLASSLGVPTPPFLSNLVDCIDVMRLLNQLRHTYWWYNGPIKVPGFDGFVLTHEVLKSAVQGQGGYERLVEAQRKYGNQFGNLLQLGGLAFAPENDDVARLVEHMNSTYRVRIECSVSLSPSLLLLLDVFRWCPCQIPQAHGCMLARIRKGPLWGESFTFVRVG